MPGILLQEAMDVLQDGPDHFNKLEVAARQPVPIRFGS